MDLGSEVWDMKLYRCRSCSGTRRDLRIKPEAQLKHPRPSLKFGEAVKRVRCRRTGLNARGSAVYACGAVYTCSLIRLAADKTSL